MATEKSKQSKNVDNLKICSININGLNNKLDAISNLMKDNQIDIFCIQETHNIDVSKIDNWKKIHNFEIFKNQNYGNKKDLKYAKEGTIVVMRKNVKENFEITEKILVQNRVQLLNCKNPSNTFILINCYFPQ